VKFLLDTDHISFLQRSSSIEFARLTNRMNQYPPSDFALSVISLHEQFLGVHSFINRARTNADLIRGYTLLREILSGFSSAPVLPFDAEAVAIFDSLREQRLRISTMDLRIAAIARSSNLVLLTRNASDFAKVPSLAIEDWTV
jgi:tRNA(fMet)-specific endonuclease VapC